MLNVSTLTGARTSASDALRYGQRRAGEVTPGHAAERRPVVVWNATRACNLACAHCYASARLRRADDELETEEAEAFLTDLAAFGVPAVLLSGGEPLTRVDLPHLVRYGGALGLRFTLSTNGTLIDDVVAGILADCGVVYVGVSIDGDQETHDHLRREGGAHRRAIEGLRHLSDAGVRRGVRFTVSPDTLAGLPAVLDLVVREGIERFCMYHLVPSGRGARLHDVAPGDRRQALELVFAFALEHPEVEVLTVDNPSDGAALYRWLKARGGVGAEGCKDLLEWNGGARHGPGIGLAAVDERGDVHPDQFSRHRVLGNVLEQPFSQIWSDPEEPYLRALRDGERPVPESCRGCPYLAMCGGGLRSRAEIVTGDAWGFDPSCTVARVA